MVEARPWLPDKWDKQADVVIVGYGGAGAVAAITVGEAADKVLLLEKAPEPGGSTSTASGGMKYIVNAQQAAQFIKNLGFGSIDDETARAFAETWVEMKPWLEKHGARLIESSRLVATRPPVFKNLAPPDIFDTISLESPEGYPRGCGRDLFAFLDGIVKSLGVEIMLNTPVKRLVQDPLTKEVLGIVAESEGQEIFVKARKAVIMTCGGFAGNPEMLATYVEEAPVKMYPSGSPYCTGDGIKMVSAVGADLWHMNAIEWATQGFKPDEIPAAFWLQPKGQSWINVNRYGRRFRDESTSLVHAKSHLPIFDFTVDNTTGEIDWPNSTWYLVFDEKVKKAGPVVLTERSRGSPPFVTYNSAREIYTWSQDNSAEISRNWIRKADSLYKLANEIEVAPAALQETIDNYNEYCRAASDPKYHRKPETLVPIDTSPYYALECVVGIINTQGGPRRNANSQVVSALDGSPISRLYAGGEFGSIFGFLYPGACNLSECIVSGLLSGRHAVAEVPWD